MPETSKAPSVSQGPNGVVLIYMYVCMYIIIIAIAPGARNSSTQYITSTAYPYPVQVLSLIHQINC